MIRADHLTDSSQGLRLFVSHFVQGWRKADYVRDGYTHNAHDTLEPFSLHLYNNLIIIFIRKVQRNANKNTTEKL